MYCYDLYMSIGSACRPAKHLKDNDLRKKAYPLDWQMGYSLDTVIHLFSTQFCDFFSEIKEDTNLNGAGDNRRIIDINNNIVSIHHFSKKIEIEDAKKSFIQVMNKRFLDLDNELKSKKNIVLICNRKDTADKLILFLKQFSSLYTNF